MNNGDLPTTPASVPEQNGRQLERVVLAVLGVGLLFFIGVLSWARWGDHPVSLPVLGQISNFHLTNQNQEPISLDSLRGQVWLTDVIFTRCPGPCARMTRQLAAMQSSLPAGQALRFVSLTSDPEYDTPAVMHRYADRFGADSNRWWFLSGAKPEIRRLEINDFKFVAVDKTPAERESPDDLFIHSTFFVVVDKFGQVRGWTDANGQVHAYYNSEDPAAVAQAIAAMKQLLTEKSKP